MRIDACDAAQSWHPWRAEIYELCDYEYQCGSTPAFFYGEFYSATWNFVLYISDDRISAGCVLEANSGRTASWEIRAVCSVLSTTAAGTNRAVQDTCKSVV